VRFVDNVRFLSGANLNSHVDTRVVNADLEHNMFSQTAIFCFSFEILTEQRESCKRRKNFLFLNFIFFVSKCNGSTGWRSKHDHWQNDASS